MRHESLILSDTAMVLLRRRSFENQHVESDQFILERRRVPRVSPYLSRDHIDWELLNEIWHLWMYPDIPVARQLDWHLTLSKRGMSLCSFAFDRRNRWFQGSDSRADDVYRQYGLHLVEYLVKAYKAVLLHSGQGL